MVNTVVNVPDVGSEDPVDVIEISVSKGDKVEEEQTLLVLESAKATIEVPAPLTGIISEICTQVGKQVKTGDLIFKIESTAAVGEVEAKKEGEQAKTALAADERLHCEEDKHQVKQAEKLTQGRLPEPRESNVRLSNVTQQPVHAGPSVRRLGSQLGVDLSEITGSGPKQRILKEDVHGYVKTHFDANDQAAAPYSLKLPTIDFSQWGEIEPQALTKIQSLSAKNLQRAWQLIPHVTQFDEANISSLESFRTNENKRLKPVGQKLTLLAFIVKASVQALKAFPRFCSSYNDENNQVIYKKYYHIGFAADTENGLVVPVIRNADQKSVIEIASELAELSERARNKKLKPQEMQGGCFTVSSLGGIGGTAFTPIVNWPEVAILGVSKSQKRVVLEDGQCTNHLMLPLSLSYDHRVIDGADAARFTAYLALMLSDARRILL